MNICPKWLNSALLFLYQDTRRPQAILEIRQFGLLSLSPIHRCSAVAQKLSRNTGFSKLEIMRLIVLHYAYTTKRNRTMDKLCFVEFMDTFLDFRNVDAIEKMHELRCKTNKKSLTEQEFVELLSLLLKGKHSALFKRICCSCFYLNKNL